MRAITVKEGGGGHGFAAKRLEFVDNEVIPINAE